uniref:Agglutinin domain-containing protein n=1 Tax=Arundo donax TaxID=35708 RepID=A0A0A8Z1U0_ARUDO
MLSSLPICAAFQSKNNGKYLRYNVPDGEEANNQLLQLSGEDAVNPYTRFFIEPSAKHDGLVHIRCCYNNKYWVAQQGLPYQWWIAGSADEPEEDQTQESCTLFELKPVEGDSNNIRFSHARLGKYSGMFPYSNQANEVFQACLCVGDKEQWEQFTMVHLSPWVLPKHVCFKGDNGRYLSSQLHNGHQFLLFTSEDIGDPSVRHSTMATNDGTMLIKSDHFGQFWRRSDSIDQFSWIIANSSSNNNPDTLFKSVPFDDGKIGLVNMGNSQYCKRLIIVQIRNGLSATGHRDEPFSRLSFEEPVLSREINNIQFRPNQAKIYGQNELILDTASVTNNTSSVMSSASLTMEFTVEETRRWASSMTLRSPVRSAITSRTLTTVDGRSAVETGEFRGLYSWGATNVKRTKESVVLQVDVPPMTKVTVTCRARESSYDVPFSYRQVDKMIDGAEVSLPFDDGIYSGRNAHSIVYDFKEEKINQ